MSSRMEWEKFWYRDFCDDLRPVALATRGFWIFCLAKMWGDGGVGEITATYEEFARIAGCSVAEAELCIKELEDLGICDVVHATKVLNFDATQDKHIYNEYLTVINRRLKKYENKRKTDRLRFQRWNEKQKSNASLTPKKHGYNAEEDKKIEEKNKYIIEFFKFWTNKFNEKFSQKYVVQGAKETNLLKTLFKSFSPEELKNKAETFFSCNDDFIKKSGYTIGVFYSQINKLSTLKKSRWK